MKFILTFLLLMLFSAMPSLMAQDITEVQGLLDQADSIRAVRYSMRSKPELRKGILKINEVITALKELSDFDTSVEWAETVSTTIKQLERRRGAYSQCINDKCPGDTGGTARDCIDMIRRYSENNKRHLFEKNDNSKSRFVKRQFLKKFGYCLSVVSKNDSVYSNSGSIISLLLPPSEIVRLMLENPNYLHDFQQNLPVLKDSLIAVHIREMTKWMQSSGPGANFFWESVVSKQGVETASAIFFNLITHLQDAPENASLWQNFVENFPFSEVDGDFMKSLGDMAMRIRNKQWAMTILDSLIAKNTTLQTEKSDSVRRGVDLYRSLSKEQLTHQQIIDFVQRTNAIQLNRNKEDEVFLFHDAFLSGPGSDVLDEEYKKLIHEQFRKTFTGDGRIVKINTIDTKNALKLIEQIEQSNKIDRFALPGSLKERQVFVGLASYIYNRLSKKLQVYFYLADGHDGLVLLKKSKNFYLLNIDTINFSNELSAFYKQFSRSLDEILIGASTLQQIIDTPLSWDANKIKSALYYGINFEVNKEILENQYYLIDNVELNGPFWANERDARLTEFKDNLEIRLRREYPGYINYPRINKADTLRLMELSGQVVSEDPLIFNIFFKTDEGSRDFDGIDTLASIKFNFLKHVQGVNTNQINRAIDVVMQNLNASTKQRQSPEGQTLQIPYAQSLTSLFFAGTAQFSLAERIHPEQPWKLRIPAYTFALSELGMLVGAGISNRNAIHNLDNKSLQARNNFLIAAGTIAVISTIYAYLKIRKHKKLRR